jgi:muramidase (phage lysozyme)
MMPRINPEAVGGVNVCAFLDMLAVSEGTSTIEDSDDGYNVIVGGDFFSSYVAHPRIAVQTRWGWSDAAGRYQIMAAIPGKIRTDTWDWASRACKVTDFSPESQDQVALYLIARRGALPFIQSGRLAEAIAKCRPEWASLPGAGYGQHENSFEQLKAVYQVAGGEIQP